jgi:hypothetical protein
MSHSHIGEKIMEKTINTTRTTGTISTRTTGTISTNKPSNVLVASKFHDLTDEQKTALTGHQQHMHTHVVGDLAAARKKLFEEGHLVWNDNSKTWKGKKHENEDVLVEFKEIPVNDLVSLESQRETALSWAVSRLSVMNGLDKVAFGALSVTAIPCKKGEVQKYSTYDGNGRLSMAQLCGKDTVPCLVFGAMDQGKTALYFDYTQNKGRRNLKPEVKWINSYIAGNAAAKALGDYLKLLDMHIKGDTKLYIPSPKADWTEPYINSVDVKYRTVNELLVSPHLSNAGVIVHKLARDLIVNAWGNRLNSIPQDTLWGLVVLLDEYPNLQNKSTDHYQALESYLNWLAGGKTPMEANKDWKTKSTQGLAINSIDGAAMILDGLKKYIKSQGIKIPEVRKTDKVTEKEAQIANLNPRVLASKIKKLELARTKK